MKTLILVLVGVLFITAAFPAFAAVDKVWLDYDGSPVGWWLHGEDQWFTQIYAGLNSGWVTMAAGLKKQVGPVNVQAALGPKLVLPKGEVAVANYATKALGFWQAGCLLLDYGWEADNPHYLYTKFQQMVRGSWGIRLEQLQSDIIYFPASIGPVLVYKKGPVSTELHYGRSFFGPNCGKEGIKITLAGQF